MYGNTRGGAYIRNQDYKLKMENCIWIQYTIFLFNTTPGKSSDPGGKKNQGTKLEWNTKPGISFDDR